MLFGWGRVSKRMHFAATAIVAVGTLISATWILSANSFMQTPQGFMMGADDFYTQPTGLKLFSILHSRIVLHIW